MLLDRLGEAGVAEAERESAYFFADELPAVGAWQFDQDEAARVLAPTLLVRGAKSKPWFAENMAQLAAWLPDAREVTLEGCDHLAPLTHPAELAAATAGFAHQGRRVTCSRPARARTITVEQVAEVTRRTGPQHG